MKKEYEVPFCKVVAVENKDILTASTTSYQTAKRNESAGGYGGGAYVGWNSKW